MSTLLLVRHGEVHNPKGVRYGRLPGFHLSDNGVEQARAAAQWIHKVHPSVRTVFASPLERAMETAEIIGARLGTPVTSHPDLTEAASRLDGLPRSGSPVQMAKAFLRSGTGVHERQHEVVARMMAVLMEFVTRDESAVIVSHQHPIQFVTLSVLESERGSSVLPRRRSQCTPGSVTTITVDGGCMRYFSTWSTTRGE